MHFETLPDPARETLKSLAALPVVAPFYLAGGSAVALHLGHRISVDLDFFTAQPSYEAEPLTQALSAMGKLSIQQQSPGTLVGSLSGVKMSFFVYPYPLLEPVDPLEGVRVARLLDLALMKVIAISQRGKRRDFVDLFAICRHGLQLAEILRRIPEKYRGVSYPSYHLLRSLVYFADAEKDEPPRMLEAIEWSDVTGFFSREVPAIFKLPGE